MSISAELVAGLPALHPADRRWLLAQLGDPERRRLTALLERGAADALPAVSALDSAPAPVKSNMPEPEELSQDEALLNAAEPKIIVALLVQLPSPCVALILSQWRWPWTQSVMAALPADSRKYLEDERARAGGQPRPRFANWLLHELAEVLRRQRAESADAGHRFEVLMDTPSVSR